MNIVIPVNILNRYESILSKFPTNEKRKNCFLAACKIWTEKSICMQLIKSFPHAGRIGYGNSLLDFFLARSKIFCLHAILRDSAGDGKKQQTND